MQLEVTLEEAVAIVNLLGSLPTSQGAHPLWVKLKAQVEPEVQKNGNGSQTSATITWIIGSYTNVVITAD